MPAAGDASRAPSGHDAAARGAASATGAPEPVVHVSTLLHQAAHRSEPEHPLIGAAVPGDVHVMTFNIRVDVGATDPADPDAWEFRAPVLAEILQREHPTVLGAQEVLSHQVPTILEALPSSYRMIGQGREGGALGEFSPIFIDTDLVRHTANGQLWLSDTPRAVGSRTWGNSVPRIATWATLVENATGREFGVINTHFDHESEWSRRMSAHTLAHHVRTRFGGLPTIVLGDFNDDVASHSFDTLLAAGLRDSWTIAAEQLTPHRTTVPHYGDPTASGPRIDWLLVTPDVEVRQVGIGDGRVGGRFASDHVPVQALIRIAR